MRNILNEKPSLKLSGRLLGSVNFVQDIDIKDKDVLDIGCGFGWCELNFLDRGVKKMVGIEISENDLKTAKENIVNEKVRFKVGNATDLPFKDESFDTVVCWDVIEHIPKNTEDLMFENVNRALKPKSIFYLSAPYNSFVSKISDPSWWLIGHRHYSREELVQFGKNNNFDILQTEVKGKWYNLLGILDMYFSKWVLKRRPIFNDFLNGLIDKEYGEESGFVTIFCKFRKK